MVDKSSLGIGENQYIFHREIPLEKCELTSIPDLKPCKFIQLSNSVLERFFNF